MQKLFNNILLPVSLNRHALSVIDDAISFSNQLHCNLHLIFTPDPVFSFVKSIVYNKSQNKHEIRKLLKELHDRIGSKLTNGLLLCISYGSGNIQKLVFDYTLDHEIDLICQSNYRASSFTDQITCPILTLKSFPKNTESKNIVLPIGETLPVNKLRVASYLGRNLNSTIHLVSCKNKNSPPDEFSYLGKAYRVLKDYTDVPVVCTSIEGKNLDDIAIDYAKKINAGFVVMNPAPKPFLTGFLERFFSGFNGGNPRIPVLTVS